MYLWNLVGKPMSKTNQHNSRGDFSRSDIRRNKQKKREGKNRYKEREFLEIIRKYK